MRILLLILIIFCDILGAFALEVVYPKTQNVTINGATTFFIGSASADTPLFINDKKIYPHESGGFAHFVHLKDGVNVFELKSNDEVLTYTITSKRVQNSGKCKTTKFFTPKVVITKNNGIPLRSTPVDQGINRVVHLQKGIPLCVDGESADFYRVSVSKQEIFWVAKTDVEETDLDKTPRAMIFFKRTEELPNEMIYTFDLSSQTPYVLQEQDGLKLSFYNTFMRPDASYEIYFPVQKELFGYLAQYQGEKFVLKVRKFPEISPQKPLKNIIVALDAGHGGSELGAIGCLGDKEKDINLKVALKLKKELESRGAKVVMTRETDEKISLPRRVEIANENNSAIFISIHANALPDTKNPMEHQGTSVYYYYPQAQNLAKSILVAMNNEVGTKNDGVHQRSLAVVRNTGAVSVLVELAYMINPIDNAMLITDMFQDKSAFAIADGIENWLKSVK